MSRTMSLKNAVTQRILLTVLVAVVFGSTLREVFHLPLWVGDLGAVVVASIAGIRMRRRASHPAPGSAGAAGRGRFLYGIIVLGALSSVVSTVDPHLAVLKPLTLAGIALMLVLYFATARFSRPR